MNSPAAEKQINNHHSMEEMESMSGMSMMTISWRADCAVYLFDSFHADTTHEFLIGLIIVFLSAIFAQILMIPIVKSFFIGIDPGIGHDGSHVSILHRYFENSAPTERGKEDLKDSPSTVSKCEEKVRFGKSIFRTRFILFNSFSSLFSLCVMLLAMTMNGYIILAIAFGTGIGKLIVNEISFEKQKILNEGNLEEVHDCV